MRAKSSASSKAPGAVSRRSARGGRVGAGGAEAAGVGWRGRVRRSRPSRCPRSRPAGISVEAAGDVGDYLAGDVAPPVAGGAVMPVGVPAAVGERHHRCVAAEPAQRGEHRRVELRLVVTAAAVQKDQQRAPPLRRGIGRHHDGEPPVRSHRRAVERQARERRPLRVADVMRQQRGDPRDHARRDALRHERRGDQHQQHQRHGPAPPDRAASRLVAHLQLVHPAAALSVGASRLVACRRRRTGIGSLIVLKSPSPLPATTTRRIVFGSDLVRTVAR